MVISLNRLLAEMKEPVDQAHSFPLRNDMANLQIAHDPDVWAPPTPQNDDGLPNWARIPARKGRRSGDHPRAERPKPRRESGGSNRPNRSNPNANPSNNAHSNANEAKGMHFSLKKNHNNPQNERKFFIS